MSEVDGPRNTRPSLSIDKSSTSPLRKSAWVATVQNVAMAAFRPAQVATTSIDTMQKRTPVRIM